MLNMSNSTNLLIFILLGFVFFQYISSNKMKKTARYQSTCCEIEHTISIMGSASTFVPTDLIRLGFTIETKASEARNALKENSLIATRINKLLVQENNVLESNITTINIQMNPKYSPISGERSNISTLTFTGFEVTNQIEVKISDKLKAAILIDNLVAQGVNKINYIKFDVNYDKIKQTKKNLLANAIKDAYERGNIIASETKRKIKDVKSITLNNYSKSANEQDLMRVLLPEETSIYTGQQQISVTANIVFIVSNA